MLQINTKDLKNRKRVLIDDHEYMVRKLGAGEELQISQIMRELDKLGKKEKSGAEMTETDTSRALELADKMFNIVYGTFDDGGDGSKTRALLQSLSQDEMQEIQAMIFDGEPSEPIQPATAADTSAAAQSAGDAAEASRPADEPTS